MYESDKVVGMFHTEAVQFIENNDLWDEVVDLKTDCYGTVVKVIHVFH